MSRESSNGPSIVDKTNTYLNVGEGSPLTHTEGNGSQDDTPTKEDGLFRYTLTKKRALLTASSLQALHSHNVDRELASQVFDRFKDGLPEPILPTYRMPSPHPELATSVSSHDSREGGPDLPAMFLESNNDLAAELEKLDIEAEKHEPTLLSPTSYPGNFQYDLEASKEESRSLLIISEPGTPISDCHSISDSLSVATLTPGTPGTPTTSAGSKITTRCSKRSSVTLIPLQNNTEYAMVENGHPPMPEPSEEIIESILDELIPKHHAEYIQETDSLDGPARINRRRTIDRRGDHDTHPAFAAYCKLNQSQRTTSVAMAALETKNGEIEKANERAIEFDYSEVQTEDDLYREAYLQRPDSPISPSTILRNKRLSSTLEEQKFLPFTCIFTVAIPHKDFRAPLTASGRPIIPDNIPSDEFTVIATYHPSHHRFIFDLLDYDRRVPPQFNDSQSVDLLYLQRGFLPIFYTWLPKSLPEGQIEEASKYSLCTTNANGVDVLYVSDLHVMSYLIVNCMYRVFVDLEGPPDDSLFPNGRKACKMDLTNKATGMCSATAIAEVALVAVENPVWQWQYADRKRHVRLGHSRRPMPVRALA